MTKMKYLLHRYQTRFTWLNLVDTKFLIVNYHHNKKIQFNQN